MQVELAMQVLELVLVVPLTLFGATTLVAGDRVREPMPWTKLPRGWPLRFIGLLLLVGGTWFCFDVVTNGITLDAVVILYLAAAVSVVSVVQKSRRSA